MTPHGIGDGRKSRRFSPGTLIASARETRCDDLRESSANRTARDFAIAEFRAREKPKAEGRACSSSSESHLDTKFPLRSFSARAVHAFDAVIATMSLIARSIKIRRRYFALRSVGSESQMAIRDSIERQRGHGMSNRLITWCHDET